MARDLLPSSSGSLPVLVEANSRGRSGPLTDPKQHPCTHPTAGAPRRVEQPAVVLTEQTASVHLCHLLAKSGVADRGEAAAITHRRRLDQRSPASAWFLLLGARSGAPAISQTAVQGCVLEPLCARDAPKQPRPKATTDERSRRSTPVSWAWLDLNQRPHPERRIARVINGLCRTQES